MNLSFAVVFAMSAAHAGNYLLHSMSADEYKRAKRASVAALHSTLEKLVSRNDSTASKRVLAAGIGLFGSKRRLFGAPAASTGTAKVEPEPDDFTQLAAGGTKGGVTTGFSPLSAQPHTIAPLDMSTMRQSPEGPTSRQPCFRRFCASPCTFLSKSWKKASLTRKVDISITCASFLVYVAGTVWIFSWPSASTPQSS